MKKSLLISLIMALPVMASAQTKILISTEENRSMTATLVDNEATKKLIALLAVGPITIEMNDYGGFEKVGDLPEAFPTSNSQITTEPGDIMLYQGRSMVIFYGTNTWSYTPLGKIDNTSETELRKFLGTGKITLTISNVTSGLIETTNDTLDSEEIYDIKGQKYSHRPLSPGVYIINGKKVLIHK